MGLAAGFVTEHGVGVARYLTVGSTLNPNDVGLCLRVERPRVHSRQGAFALRRITPAAGALAAPAIVKSEIFHVFSRYLVFHDRS